MSKKREGIAVGSKCTWWDDAQNAMDVGGVLLCPHCKEPVRGVVESEEKFMQGVNERPDDFKAFVKWTKGKCFTSFDKAAISYRQHTGKQVRL